MRAREHAALVGIIAVLALVAAACCGGEQAVDGRASPTPTAPETTPAAGSAVEVVDSLFQPPELTVAAGTEVVWTQTGVSPHTVTADDGSFDSHEDCTGADPAVCLGQGGTFKHAFTKPGRVPYYCKVHGGRGGIGMAGVIIVQ